MSTLNDKKVLNAILNPNTPFEEEPECNISEAKSKYESGAQIDEAKKLEVEGQQFESIESLNASQKKERKELQSKIQSLKKSITKGDRKKKKEVDAEIENLEKEFEEKCKLELKNFEDRLKSSNMIENNSSNEPKHSNALENENDLEVSSEQASKLSKSKKRKEKKEKQIENREKLIEIQEEENKKGPAFIELNKIKEKLNKKGLEIKEVRSDGNCMYYAISDQLSQNLNINNSYEDLRHLTAEYMLKNPREFQPFISSETSGEPLNEQEYIEYCLKIKETLEWGGQLELRAISDIFKTKIEVVQAEGSDIIIGEEQSTKEKSTLILTYHRFMFGTGEHYNSTCIKKRNENDFEQN